MTLDPLTFIFEIINFLVLLWLLKRFLYKPVQQAIMQRQQQAAAALNAAVVREQAAAAALATHTQALQDWQHEKQHRQNALHAELAEERDKTLLTIQAAAQTEKQRLQSLAIQDQARQALAMQQQAATLALKMSRHFLQRCAGHELDDLLFKLFLDDLSCLSSEQKEQLRQALNGNGSVQLHSARPLSAAQQNTLSNALQALLAAPLTCHFDIRADLISGLRIEIGAQVLHANLADELAFFHTGLMHV